LKPTGSRGTVSSVLMYQRCHPPFVDQSANKNALYNTDCYCTHYDWVPL
jgi:hypothetical protein